MIICAGEILADMTITNAERGAEGRISAECSAGGAPFNVACCLKKLGVSCGFCGNVGDDVIGNYLYGIASLQNFDYLYIGKDTVHNTTLAFVRLNADGERKFGFYRKNTADAYLPVGEAENIAKKADIIHIGSLAVSSARGRLFLDKLIDGAHKQGKKISFDVNYRDDIFRDKDAAVKLYRKYIRKADIVKFSEEEIDMFVRGNGISYARLPRQYGVHRRQNILCARCENRKDKRYQRRGRRVYGGSAGFIGRRKAKPGRYSCRCQRMRRACRFAKGRLPRVG